MSTWDKQMREQERAFDDWLRGAARRARRRSEVTFDDAETIDASHDEISSWEFG